MLPLIGRASLMPHTTLADTCATPADASALASAVPNLVLSRTLALAVTFLRSRRAGRHLRLLPWLHQIAGAAARHLRGSARLVSLRPSPTVTRDYKSLQARSRIWRPVWQRVSRSVNRCSASARRGTHTVSSWPSSTLTSPQRGGRRSALPPRSTRFAMPCGVRRCGCWQPSSLR